MLQQNSIVFWVPLGSHRRQCYRCPGLEPCGVSGSPWNPPPLSFLAESDVFRCDIASAQALSLCLPLPTVSTAFRLEQKLPSDSTQGSKVKPRSHCYVGLIRGKFVLPSSLRVSLVVIKSILSPPNILHFPTILCLSGKNQAKGKSPSSHIYVAFSRPG